MRAVSSIDLGIVIAIAVIVWLAMMGLVVFWVVVVFDIVRRPEWQWKVAGEEKLVWLVIVIILNVMAVPSVIYWFSIRKNLRAVADAADAGVYGPGRTSDAGWEPFPPPLPQPRTASPGWYPDSAVVSRLRWWDGTRWTEHTAPGSPGSP